MALDFLKEASIRNQPWACFVSFSEPNVPVIPGQRMFDKYDVDTIPLPENLHGPFDGEPSLYRRIREVYAGVTKRNWRELRACYFALISELDEQLGRLIDLLDARGITENTYVFVLSDHGRYVGAHGFDNHNFGAFEEAYRIPLVISGPGVNHDVVRTAHISIADCCPTILELAGAQMISDIDGASFAAILRDPGPYTNTWDHSYQTSCAEFHGTRFLLSQRILWHRNWKYVFNGFDYDELYDLEQDPHETCNLALLPQYQKIAGNLMKLLWRKIKETGDTSLAETHYFPMRFGIVGPNVD